MRSRRAYHADRQFFQKEMTARDKQTPSVTECSAIGSMYLRSVFRKRRILTMNCLSNASPADCVRYAIGGIKTYNIEIDGADHFDYMRRSGETDPVKADFNRRVSKFVTDLTLVSNNDQDLNNFLVGTMVAPDADGVWRFHP